MLLSVSVRLPLSLLVFFTTGIQLSVPVQAAVIDTTSSCVFWVVIDRHRWMFFRTFPFFLICTGLIEIYRVVCRIMTALSTTGKLGFD